MTEETTDEQQKNRKGVTKISSVSISPEFKDIIATHNFSPTEVFRRGVAVMLHDAGHVDYVNELNKERSEFAEKFLKDIARFNLISKLKEIEKRMASVKRLIKDIDEYTENGGVQ
jgi:hypothetical protein